MANRKQKPPKRPTPMDWKPTFQRGSTQEKAAGELRKLQREMGQPSAPRKPKK